MENLQFIYQKKFISKLLIFLLIINSFIFTEGLINPAYANPVISDMSVNTNDNEVSVYGTGSGNGTNLADKPFRYTIGSSQSEWVRDSSNITINETLTSGTLSNTQVENNNLRLSTSGGGVFLNGYAYKSTIIIDHTKIDADLANFPLTVYLNSSNFDFNKAKADGSDIRFTDKDLNPLKFEREEHSAANAKAVYNVLIPTVSNTADTEIYMWYGHVNSQNFIDNGDFHNGTSGWIQAVSSGFSVQNGIASFTPSGQFGRIETTPRITSLAGHKYYTKAKIRTTDSTASCGIIYYADGNSATIHTGSGNWEDLSSYSWSNTDFVGNAFGIISYATSGFVPIEVDDFLVIDLTKLYGAGNEPTKAWCDANISFNKVYNTSIESWQDQIGKQLNYNGNVKLVTGIQPGKRVASFDGSGDYITLTDSDDFEFGNGDFCIEVNLIRDAVGAINRFIGKGTSSNTVYKSWYIQFEANNTMEFGISDGATEYSIKTTDTFTSTSEIYNVTMVRKGSTLYGYVNGVLRGTRNVSTISAQNLSCVTGIGALGAYDVDTFKGKILGVRITKGRARYASTFTSPDTFSVDGSDVVFCTNFDTIYDSNYAMIQHMGDSLVDATGNGNNGTANGTTVINTEYGKARSFNGISDYITVFGLYNNPSKFTMSSFANIGTIAGAQSLFNDDGGGYGQLMTNNNSQMYFAIHDTSAKMAAADYTPYINVPKVYSGRHLSGDYTKLYFDGLKVAQSTSIANYVSNVTNSLKIGKAGAGYLKGIIMDTRYSNIARSDAWIKAESLSLKNSLVTYSAPIVSLQYASSGTRESGVYDVSGSVGGSRVQWTESKPAGTNVIVESNVSLDGGSSWLGWKPCINGSSIADLTSGSNTSNARLKIRQTLSTSSSAITPSISNSIITINFSKYVHQVTATPNKEYTVKFEVKDASGNITSETKKVYTKAQTPQYTISNKTTNSVDLVFSDLNPAETEYQIMCDSSYVNSSGVLTSVPTWITLKNKSITVLGLNIGTMYNFTAKARNAAEEETNYGSPIYSGTDGIPVPTGSAILAATSLNNSVSLGWNEIPNSLSYELEMDGVIKNVGLKTSYIHKDLMTNTQHTYRVRGRNQGGFSAWSEFVTINTTNNLPLIPTNVLAKASNNSVTVYWNSAQDALTYTVEIDGLLITDVSKTSACLFGLEPETTHTYSVKSCNLAGESEWAQTGSITTTFLDTPQITFKEPDSNQIKIGWEKIEGATTYQIALDSNENFKTLYASDLEEFATDSSITYTHEGLPIKTAHVYRVRAISGDGQSAWSDAVTLETLPQRPAVPTNFRGNASNNFITLMWDAVQDALGYDIEVDGIVVENDNSTQYQYMGLDQYTEHTYRVRSVTGEIESYWSDIIKIWTSGGIPDVPKNVVITNSRGIATLDWDKTPGAQKYDVEVDGGIYSISDDTFVYRNIGLIDNSSTIYKETAYRVRATNDQGTSDWSGFYVNNSIVGKIQKGKELDLGLTASNIMDFSRYTLHVNYNEKALTVTDLCAYSVKKELEAGMVDGYDIEIVSFVPGHIVFRVNKIVDEGYLWTGIINNIKFVGNATGGSTLSYTAECSAD